LIFTHHCCVTHLYLYHFIQLLSIIYPPKTNKKAHILNNQLIFLGTGNSLAENPVLYVENCYFPVKYVVFVDYIAIQNFTFEQ
jgi:hypothetical protein